MSHVVNVTRHNTKLGSIPCVNLPAVVTCRPDAPCAKLTEEGGGCYCLKGRWLFKNVQKSLWNNLYAYRENPKLYFEMIAHQFQFSTVARFHSSGDIVDEEYWHGEDGGRQIFEDDTISCYLGRGYAGGTHGNSWNYSKFTVYSLRLYNRPLNEEELKSNYDKTIAEHNIN